MTDLTIGICADRNMEVGLHVTLYSALLHLHPHSKAVVHLFLKGYGSRQIEALNATMAGFKENFEMVVHDATGIDLGRGQGLHGNKMPYLLFQMPELIQADRLICLDADLLVAADLTELWQFNLCGKVAAAALTAEVRNCWIKEREFLMRLGVAAEAAYVNTGVVVIDVHKWKREGLTAKCLAFAAANARNLATADQTVFNAVLTEQVALLPECYNIHHIPTGPPIRHSTERGIHHFVGSPKPWDIFGEFLNVSYPGFRTILTETYFRNFKSYQHLRPSRVMRACRLIRSYRQAAMPRLQEWRERRRHHQMES